MPTREYPSPIEVTITSKVSYYGTRLDRLELMYKLSKLMVYFLGGFAIVFWFASDDIITTAHVNALGVSEEATENYARLIGLFSFLTYLLFHGFFMMVYPKKWDELDRKLAEAKAEEEVYYKLINKKENVKSIRR